LLCVFICTLTSCNEEISNEPAYDDVILKAQNWLINEYPQTEVLKYSDLSSERMKIKPCWGSSFYRKYKDLTVVEVPLLTQGKFGYATIDAQAAFETNEDERYLQSLTRMIIINSAREKKTVGFFMTLIPDSEYRKENNHKVFASVYGAWQKGYSGFVLYHRLDGSYINGWKFDDKVVTHTLQLPNGTDSNLDFQIIPTKIEEACSDYYMTTWTQTCTDWYQNGEYTNTTCDAPSTETGYLYRLCNYSGGSPGTVRNGSNGFYDLPESPDINEYEPTPCEGDPIYEITGVAPTELSGKTGGTFGCVRAGSDANCNYTNAYHGGLDLICDQNTPVYSMLSGKVIMVVNSFAQDEYASESYGNYITIRHTYLSGSTVDIKYTHLNYVYYSVGDMVDANLLIGRSEKTGNAAVSAVIAHLHIEVKLNGVSVNPANYLATLLSSNGTVIANCDANTPPFLID